MRRAFRGFCNRKHVCKTQKPLHTVVRKENEAVVEKNTDRTQWSRAEYREMVLGQQTGGHTAIHRLHCWIRNRKRIPLPVQKEKLRGTNHTRKTHCKTSKLLLNFLKPLLNIPPVKCLQIRFHILPLFRRRVIKHIRMLPHIHSQNNRQIHIPYLVISNPVYM